MVTWPAVAGEHLVGEGPACGATGGHVLGRQDGLQFAERTSGRVEYRLTDKGRAFFPHVMVMLNWGDNWFRAPEGPATMLTHTGCGGEFRPVLHCSVCGLELHGSQIQVGGDPPKAAEPKTAEPQAAEPR